MKTIVVDTFDKAALKQRIAEQNLVKGDTLRFILGNREESAMLTHALALLVIHLDEANSNHDFANSIIKDLFGDKTTEEMEREIEQEYGVIIEVEDTAQANLPYQKGEEILKTFQEKAIKSWGGKIDGDAFLNEIRERQ